MYASVICKKEGFRRAGRAWPAGPSVAELTDKQFELLKADSTFEVQEISEAAYGHYIAPVPPDLSLNPEGAPEGKEQTGKPDEGDGKVKKPGKDNK